MYIHKHERALIYIIPCVQYALCDKGCGTPLPIYQSSSMKKRHEDTKSCKEALDKNDPKNGLPSPVRCLFSERPWQVLQKFETSVLIVLSALPQVGGLRLWPPCFTRRYRR